jgi:hypothetical protein
MIVNAHPEVLEQAYYVTNDWKEPCDSALKLLHAAGILTKVLGVEE